jgi:hypothetical protein
MNKLITPTILFNLVYPFAIVMLKELSAMTTQQRRCKNRYINTGLHCQFHILSRSISILAKKILDIMENQNSHKQINFIKVLRLVRFPTEYKAVNREAMP